jgi:hypothetical protein
MYEEFNLAYKDFFKEPDYFKRWNNLTKIYEDDFASFRVLFLIETLGMIDKWSEPSVDELDRLLTHARNGGQIGISAHNLTGLLIPVWPLEVAKHHILIYKELATQKPAGVFFLTYIKTYSSALVQTWWAFETLINDFASIIKEQRKATIDPKDLLVLDEKQLSLDKTGDIEERSYYQPIEARIQFIYKLLTGEEIDRSGADWMNLMNLKNARDVFVHRLGKERSNKGGLLGLDQSLVIDGLHSVQKTIQRIFEKTPEFSSRFVYKYLSFWSCGFDSPFIWDGHDGNGFYFGIAKIDVNDILNLYAKVPNSFTLAKSK